MKKNILKTFVLSSILFPIVTFAQVKDLSYLINLVVLYMTKIIVLIIGLGVLLFVWNVYKYFIQGSADATARKEGGMYVLWAVLGFFAILSLWGLVAIFKNTLRLEDRPAPGFFGSFRGGYGTGGVSAPGGYGGSNGGVLAPGGYGGSNGGVSAPGGFGGSNGGVSAPGGLGGSN